MVGVLKDSKVEWIGQVPNAWQEYRLENLVDNHFSGAWGNDEKGNELDRICMRIADFDYQKLQFQVKNVEDYTKRNYTKIEISKKTLKKGDILIEKSGGGEKTPVGRAVVYNLNNNALFANFMDCIRINDLSTPDFVKYYLFCSYCRGVTNLYFNQTTGIQNLNISRYLKESKVFLPDIDMQNDISSFLDEKCAEIDKLSEDIQKQIDILNDYKKSVITRAVTKGLDPNAEMKDSGVQWIGIMPSHWAINRGKFILKYLQKPTIETDGVITCFRDGEVTLRSNRREEGFTVADKEIGYQGIDIGDLVVHGMDGFAGAIGISDSRGKASPVLNVLDTAMDKKYIMYYLRSMAYSDVFLNLATGIRVRSCDLRWNKLANLEYPIPPVEEQKKISSYIENVLEATNETILAEKDLYEKLQDYKKSIIYEYVTGKKRVA